MAHEGANVVVNHPPIPDQAENARKVVDEIRAAGGQAIALPADVSDEQQVQDLFQKMIAAMGTIDILVNNAGLQRDAALVDMTLAQWQKVISVNLTGQFLCAREAAKEFLRRGVVLEPHKIRVNSIGPGAIKTPINFSAWATPEAEAKLLTLIPYDRVGETRDIGAAAVWLASDESDYVTGTTLFVDGGMTLYPGFATGG